MLRELKIKNLALIEELTISFVRGLVVLTGETGAGKSIILQAIYLLSGGRAGTNWIRTGADAATVEAFFEISDLHGGLLEEVREKGFETEGDLIIRRVLSQNGKSRYYINGSMATAKMAGEITEGLINVASQHDHQQLLKPRNHLDFIDLVGNHWQEREHLGRLYQQWLDLKKDYEELVTQEKDKEQRRDFLSYQCREIDEAQLRLGEDYELVREKDRLKASGDLSRLGYEGHELLINSIVDNLAIVRKNLEQMAALDGEVAKLSEELAGHCYGIDECVLQLSAYVENIPSDPSLLDSVTERIDLLQKLKRKYGETLEEVVAFSEKARLELDELDAMDAKIEETWDQLDRQGKELLQLAQGLSGKRRETAVKFANSLMKELQSLNFAQAQFEVYFAADKGTLDSINKTGWDRLEFLFSANPGEPLKPLAAVASGGELSRLMLALKCILAGKDMVETVIFDEIDAGISGKTAEAVAKKIKELAGHHQILCITHLPQIAAGADDHYLVSKSVTNQRTRTNIVNLSNESRIEEMARMLDGDSVTPQTLAYARELISRNR